MEVISAVAVAVTFMWLGMVLAISFMEAPLKFRADGMTLKTGLSVGRLVFRALNRAEAVLASIVVCTLIARVVDLRWSHAALWLSVGCLVVQLVAIRPRLTRRTEAVLAGEHPPRSRLHLRYVAFEVLKVLALGAGGCLTLVDLVAR